MRKLVDWAFFVALCAGAGYFAYTHQAQVHGLLRVVEQKVVPCSSPLTYSIGSVDPRFGISTSTLIADLKQAEDLWENPSGKDLFAYTDTGGDVTVNLVYDSRQASTDRLKVAGIQVDKSQSSYEALKARYDALSASLSVEQSRYKNALTAYKSAEAAFNTEVRQANSRGGASPEEYARLQSEKTALEQQFAQLQSLETATNADIDTLNALATTLNQIIVQLNLNVSQYNQAGAGSGEFEEGLYELAGGLQTISIYEYSDHAQLVRVLAHEMGHALGLDHVDTPGAVMYKINQGTSLQATNADTAALNAVCRTQPSAAN